MHHKHSLWCPLLQVHVVQPMTGASSLIAVGRTTRITRARAKSRLLSVCHAQHIALCHSPKCVQMILSIVRTGGRYDGLLKSLWPPAQGQPMGAVGATLNVDRLIALAAPQTLRSSSLQASQAGPRSPIHWLHLPQLGSNPGQTAAQPA